MRNRFRLVCCAGALLVGACASTQPEPAVPAAPTEAEIEAGIEEQWQGTWSGEGVQKNGTTTWTIWLTVDGDSYTVKYPSIPCEGTLQLVSGSGVDKTLKETITSGTCTSDGTVKLRLDGFKVLYEWYAAGSDERGATATLTQ